ncbi:MAG: hypothetical protein AAGI52_04365 [Bacteroidota bacterium]
MSRPVSFLALALFAAPLAAQPLDADAASRHGTIQAGSDATDDLTFDVSPDAEHPEADCPGFLTPGAPDAVVEWSDTSPMRLWVRSALDATMTIIGPDSEVVCIDDEDGVQPALLLEQPTPGRYAVWVGSFMSDLDASPAATLHAGPPPPAVGLGSDADSLPFSGVDDAEMEVIAGGLHPAEELGMPDYCVGFYNSEPTARVSGPSPYNVTATSDADLTLAVRTSGGGWVCNDDASPFDGTDPAVEVQGAGEQTVWVGTFRGYARGEAPEATLTVTNEVIAPPMPLPPPPEPIGSREYFSEAEYVSLDLDARGEDLTLEADEEGLEREFELGTGVGNPLSGMGCSGNISLAPTLTFTSEGEGPITLLASGDDDLVMVARDAQGNWFCSDDATGRDPAIEVGTGETAVWIGTFGELDSSTATFTATRGEIGDVLPEPESMDFDEEIIDTFGASYSTGTYSGNELGGQAQNTLVLDDGRAEALVFAGGELFNPVIGEVCTGYLTTEPTARLDSDAEMLAMTAYASFEEDLTLVIQTPDGDWYCSDDFDGTAPGVEVSGGGDGTYTIWVGTFQSMDAPVEAALSVVEGSLDDLE